jgi:hypothetical protein
MRREHDGQVAISRWRSTLVSGIDAWQLAHAMGISSHLGSAED